jgi:hypothetical protein
MSQEASIPSERKRPYPSNRDIRRNFWIGSEGHANFFSRIDKREWAIGPTVKNKSYWQRAKLVADEAVGISLKEETGLARWKYFAFGRGNILHDLLFDDAIRL